MSRVASLHPLQFEPLVRRVLEADLGRAGDLTTDAIVPEDLEARGQVVARAAGTVAGLEVAAAAFRLLDERCRVDLRHRDCDRVKAGTVLAEVSGPARALLAAERTALNFLGHLSGVATVTAGLVSALKEHGTGVACTRKTTPGLRLLEKYAVRAGGGVNHRFGLGDAVLIKDNHRLIAGGVRPAVERARQRVGHLVKVEVEVDTLAELEEAMEVGVDCVLLDNMSLGQLRRAVEIVAARATTEASGGITPETAPAIAATGVDLISVGWLTHSAPSLDVAFDLAAG